MNGQVKRYEERGLEGPWSWELLSPWSCGAPPSQHADVFTNREHPQIFREAFSCRHDRSLLYLDVYNAHPCFVHYTRDYFPLLYPWHAIMYNDNVHPYLPSKIWANSTCYTQQNMVT